MKTFKLKTNSLSHQFYTWGKPSLPKLFLFHGWMDSGASFNFVCEYLQKKFYCIALDLRGFGRTEHTRNPLGYFFFEYVADVHEIFKKLAPDEKIKCVGHSMGGNLLSLYAGAFPERVSHLINLEGFGIRDMPPDIGPTRLREWVESSPRDFRTYKNLKGMMERLSEKNPRIPKERLFFVVKYLSKKTKKGHIFSSDPKHKWPNPYLYRLENILPFWKNIQANCLLVLGEKSEMVHQQLRLQEELEKRLSYFPKSSERVVIKDCGHMIHLEKPEELAKTVLTWI